MGEIIRVTNLKKKYQEVEAIKGINFYVQEGSLFAFLGTNGAGKSTTIDIISTLLEPSEGEVIIDGYKLGRDNEKIRSLIGIVFQESILDPLLTVHENLDIRGSFYGLSKKEREKAIQRVTEIVNLEDFLNQEYGKLSGGQKRRADIARALINEPKILFLDEPTTGLDPKTRRNVWKVLLDLQKKTKMTIFLTTHYMEEAVQANYVTIIKSGQIIAKGTPSELKMKYSHDWLKILPKNKNNIIRILKQQKVLFGEQDDILVINLKETIDAIEIIKNCEADIENFEVLNGTMDEVFLEIVETKGKKDVCNC